MTDLPAPSAPRWANSSGTRYLVGGIALLIVLIGWMVVGRAITAMGDSADRVARAQQAAIAIRGVAMALRLASDNAADADRAALESAHHDYRAELAALRRLLADEPAELTQLDRLDSLVTEQRAFDPDAAGTEPAALIAGPLAELAANVEATISVKALHASAAARLAAEVRTVYAGLFLVTIAGTVFLLDRSWRRQERDEARLRQALSAADAANGAKTEFLANVSHEIRTPLNAVSGMSEMLLDTGLNLEQAELARAVHTNAEALTMLIGDLLDSSRLDAGQVFLEAAPVDVRDLVEGVAELLVVRAEAKGVDLIVDVPPDVPRLLIGDRMRLRQVLMNLVGNAVKFTDKGEVTVRLRAEPVADRRLAVRLMVTDTGIGIPIDAQARIFDRFAQAQRSTARRFGGTGLGLSISQSLIGMMGGRITVQSQPGQGSTFTVDVTLPLAPAQPAPDITPASLPGVDVLIVQRNAAQRDASAGVLRYAGATVRAVSRADEAMAEVARRPPRVLAVGERLDDSSGVDLAAQIWRGRGSAAAPLNVILMCSLRAMAAGNVGSYGITGCVYKPIKQARLVQTICEAAGIDAKARGEAASPGAPQPSPANPPVRRRILLVEDNKDNWVLAMRILGPHGCDVDRAENGADAVAMATSHAYDLILMDLALPDVDGIEATRRIRAQESGPTRVPIVALTAHAVGSVREDALAAGVDDYITKPFDRAQLLSVCDKYLDRNPLVLVADDVPDNQLLIATYLRSTGYRLIQAVNGREAVDLVKRHRPSLVLLDMNMPVMNGYEAASAIRQLAEGRSVPILGLTAYDGPQERERCLSAGCTAYLAKPITRSAFLARVSQLLGAPRRVRTAEPLPASLSAQETGDELRRRLAASDFSGVVTLARTIGAAASQRQDRPLEAVCTELVDAAGSEDAERSEWWTSQVLERLQGAARSDAPPTGRDHALDALTGLVALTLDARLAAVTVVDGDTAWVRGATGAPSSLKLLDGVSRERSLTALIIESRRPLTIADVRQHSRAGESLVAAASNCVSVAGVPFTAHGGSVRGALLAMDSRPRQWATREVSMLEECARIAARLLDPPPAALDGDVHSGAECIVDDDMIDLVPDYVAERRQNVLTLRENLSRRDFVSIGDLGHRMKGSGVGYGLPEVSRIGGALEDAARDSQTAAVGQLIDELDHHLKHLRIRSADGRVSMEL